MFKKKRVISMITSLVFGATNVIGALPVLAMEDTSQTFSYENYQVEYNVTNSYNNTQVVSITIANTGEDDIEDWMLYFDPMEKSMMYGMLNRKQPLME